MNATRALISSELRSYREAIAAVVRHLRPDVEVYEADSGDLNREVLRLRPVLVICGQATSLVRERVQNWVELYPECEQYSVVCVQGGLETIEDMQLSDLMAIVDRAIQVSHLNPN